MSGRETIRVYLEEIVPALSAAGMDDAAIKALLLRANTRLGAGGTPRQYLYAIAAEVVSLDDPVAEKAYLLAVSAATKTLTGKDDA